MSQKIVGVTVGIMPTYHKLAELSANCFSHMTGLDAVVLGDKEQAKYQVHAAAIRLFLFDLIDADVLVYFDADWFCLNRWDPSLMVSNNFIACRDFILQDEWPRQKFDFNSIEFTTDSPTTPELLNDFRDDYVSVVKDFAKLQQPSYKWINSGMFIINRDLHHDLLQQARYLYQSSLGHHPEYFEQPALNKALEVTSTPIRYLSRKYNLLAAYEHTWPSNVIGLHIKMKRHQEFLKNLNNGKFQTPQDVRTYFFNEPSY